MMDQRLGRRAFAGAAVLALAGCDLQKDRDPRNAAGETALCQVVTHGYSLADDLRESSGVAESRRHPGVYWSHNDSGRDPDLFAVGSDGRHLGKLKVTGAQNHDWEDIADGPCPDGGATCLYIADTGNNERKRETVSLWVFPEPEPGDGATPKATEYKARWPGEPMDVEAIFVLGDGRVYLVSKGSGKDPIALIRWPTPLRAGAEATLEQVRQLAPNPGQVGDRVTSASATPDGRWVAVRTYAALDFYRTADLLGTGGPFAQFDLDPVAEPQGEAVAMDDNGNVVLTSEGPGKHLPGTISQLRCMLPRE
ncbi:MAG TPA: hypothetical protein VFJ16_23425 [Longimicrobium sp.]|nr:hypothetical protein [Longimicrobium sp.]